ncbi:MAG: lysophospholipid acyltransferase family protein [Clostridia bacterium]
MLYNIILSLVKIYYFTVRRLKIVGKENVPVTGALIVAANHVSVQDPLVVACALPRKISYMSKSELFKNPFVAKFLRALLVFPVDRGKGDLVAMRAALKVLQLENCLGIFPEGTRNLERPIKALLPIKAGTALLASMASAPVLPVAIQGTDSIFSKIIIRIGTPLYLTHSGDLKLNKELQAKFSEDITHQITALYFKK